MRPYKFISIVFLLLAICTALIGQNRAISAYFENNSHAKADATLISSIIFWEILNENREGLSDVIRRDRLVSAYNDRIDVREQDSTVIFTVIIKKRKNSQIRLDGKTLVKDIAGKSFDFEVAEVSISAIKELLNKPDILFIEPAYYEDEQLNQSVNDIKADQVWIGGDLNQPLSDKITGKDVLIGIIDSKPNRRHFTFQDGNGNSRFQSYDNSDARKHGSHVAGIAAGRGTGTPPQMRGVAYESDLYWKPLGTTASNLISVNELIEHAGNQPLVINFSAGSSFGPRSGTTNYELALNSLIAGNKVFVKSAGNQSSDAYYGHIEGIVPDNAGEFVEFEVKIRDMSDNKFTLEIWHNSAFDIVVSDADWFWSDTIRFGNTDIFDNYDWPSDDYIEIYNSETNYLDWSDTLMHNTDTSRVILINYNSSGNKIRSGTYVIRLFPHNNQGGHFDAYFNKNISYGGFINGDNYQTITTPGYASKVITVSAHRKSTDGGDWAPYSSLGPTRIDGISISKPDIAAPGGYIPNPENYDFGIFSADSILLYEWVPMHGTSMAAPHVTGAIALLMQNFPQLSAIQVKDILQKSAAPIPNGNWQGDTTLTNEDKKYWGAGKLDILAAYQSMVGFDSVPLDNAIVNKMKNAFSSYGKGLPIEPVVSNWHNEGFYKQKLTDGAIFLNETEDFAYYLGEGIWYKWIEIGDIASILGLPTTSEFDDPHNNDFPTVYFEHGKIYWNGNEAIVCPVLPDFSVSQTDGSVPHAVVFEDASFAENMSITSWLWDFGDGNTSIFQNPVHVYETSGSFTVSLTVYDNNYGFTAVKHDYITTFLTDASAEIVKLEYFFNEDPGYGNGINIPFEPDSYINIQANLDISAINPGMHRLYIRAKDEFGHWSVLRSKPVYVSGSTQTNTNVSTIEYFLDEFTAPGTGNILELTPGSDITISDNLDLTGVTPGLHRLYFRAKDNQGNWGVVNSTIVYVKSYDNANVSLVEYFFDEPGEPGSGFSFPIEPGQDITIAENIDLSDMDEGSHSLFFRAKDEFGNWGALYSNEITIEESNNFADTLWQQSIIGTGAGPVGLVSADLNNNDLADIVVANRLQGSISVYLNTGFGISFTRTDYITDASPNSVAVADIDNDTDIDLVVTCQGSSSLNIFTNDGNGIFTLENTIHIGSVISSISLKDLNGDGYDDMVIASGTGYDNSNVNLNDPMLLRIFINDNNGIFLETTTHSIGLYSRFSNYELLNQTVSKDGFELKDVLIPYASTFHLNTTAIDTVHSISIPTLNMYQTFPVGIQRIVEFQALDINDHSFYCNMPGHNESGHFRVRRSLVNHNMSIFDIDNDEDNDLVISSWAFPTFMGNGALFVFLNDGYGVFELQGTLATGIGPYSLTALDLDQDSYIDVVISNYFSNNISVFKNNNGVFQSAESYICPRLPYSIMAGDYNNDGIQDIISLIPNKDSVAVFMNDGEGSLLDFNLIAAGKTPWDGTSSDFDNDGTQDFAFSNYSENQITILHSTNATPSALQLILPNESSVIQSDTVFLEWTDLTGALKYELYVDNNPGFGSPEISPVHITELQNLQENTYTISGNWLSENVYYWKVLAITEDETISSEVRSFTYQPEKLETPQWVPLYRAYLPADVDHFYCSSESHLQTAINENYQFEGVEGFVSLNPFETASPEDLSNIFRFYIPDNTTPRTRGHYYTTSEADKDNRIIQGWIYEGITGYAYAQPGDGLVPLYHNWLNIPNDRNNNFYTTSEYEKNNAISQFGYLYQGITCYVSANGDLNEQIWQNALSAVGYGVNPVNGNLGHYEKDVFHIAEGKTTLNYKHLYNSNAVRLFSSVKPLGNGWNHAYNASLITTEDNVMVVWPDHIDLYNKSGLEAITPGLYDMLQQPNAEEYTITKKNQSVFRFSKILTSPLQNTYMLTSITDRFGNAVSLQYNDLGRLEYVKSPANRFIKFEYYPDDNETLSGLIKYVKDSLALNRTVYYQYDNQRNLIHFTDALGLITNYTYDSISPQDHFLATVEYPDGTAIKNTYDPESKRIIEQDIISNERNNYKTIIGLPDNNHVDVVDAIGNQTGFSFNDLGNITSLITASGSASFYFEDSNNPLKPTKVTDGMGYTTEINYDSNGNPIAVNKPLGVSHHYEWNSTNDLLKYTNPLGVETQYTYQNGKLTSVINPRGTIGFTHFGNGNIQSVTDALGKTTSFTYDAWNNLTQITDNIGNSSNYEYDNAGKMTHSTDANGALTIFSHNLNDLLTSVTDALGYVTQYDYDQKDRLIAVTDARNNSTSTSYNDVTGWIDQTTDQLGNHTFFDYFDNGLLQSVTTRNGQILNHSYDSSNRLVSTSGAGLNRTFIYDDNNRLVELDDQHGTITYMYDSLNRLVSYTDFYNNLVQYSYDKADNIIKIIYPGNKVVDYTYYDDNLLHTVTDWLGNTSTYTYRNDGSLQRIDLPNGTYTTFSYDNASRMTGLTNCKSDESIISDYTFTLDSIGNHTEVEQQEPMVMPLLDEVEINYTYDNANRILTAGAITYGHDLNGNLTSINNEGSLSNFTYDAEDRLTAISGLENASYTYDGAGNRRSATKNGISIRYILDINSQLEKVVMDTEADNNPLYYYIHGNGLLYRIKAADNSIQYYHYDYRGSTIAITGENQNITHQYVYDEFGKVMDLSEADYNPYRFVGKYGVMHEFDDLYFMRARYYNPEIGRFLSEDPVWGVNLYSYSSNNPITKFDASGLYSEELIRYYHIQAMIEEEYYFRQEEIYNNAIADVYLRAKTALQMIPITGVSITSAISLSSGSLKMVQTMDKKNSKFYNTSTLILDGADLAFSLFNAAQAAHSISSHRLPHVKNPSKYISKILKSEVSSSMGRTYYDAFIQWIPKQYIREK